MVAAVACVVASKFTEVAWSKKSQGFMKFMRFRERSPWQSQELHGGCKVVAKIELLGLVSMGIRDGIGPRLAKIPKSNNFVIVATKLQQSRNKVATK